MKNPFILALLVTLTAPSVVVAQQSPAKTAAPQPDDSIHLDWSQLVLVDPVANLYSFKANTPIGPVQLFVQKGRPQGANFFAGKSTGLSNENGLITPGEQAHLASNGLQMSISLSGSDKTDSPSFEVMLRNVGKKDITLNLGTMLGNGKVQLPDNIRLVLKDATGKTRELLFSDKRYGGVSGRLDDYIVYLRAGSTYSVRLKLEQFWSPKTHEFELKLKSGSYQVLAQLQGVGARTHNIGSESNDLLDFWKGNLQSSALSFEVKSSTSTGTQR